MLTHRFPQSRANHIIMQAKAFGLEFPQQRRGFGNQPLFACPQDNPQCADDRNVKRTSTTSSGGVIHNRLPPPVMPCVTQNRRLSPP